MSGPDPADPNRVLGRKALQLSEGQYAYEETTVTPHNNGLLPTVHTTAYKAHLWDLKEDVTQKEFNLRRAFRPMPNCVGFSLYFRD